MMRSIVLALSLSASAALVCEDLSSCEGCVASKNENAPACKPWGPKTCTRKNNKDKWEAEWCPGDPCEEFPECDCVGEKANGARKCLTQTRDEAQCDAKGGRGKWTTSWCGAPVANPPTADIVTCFQDPNKDCEECCPACEPVGISDFNKTLLDEFYSGGMYYKWEPNAGVNGCVCLDLAQSGYGYDTKGYIQLTPFSDCARITGNDNYVYGGNGDDAMYSSGDDSVLDGEDGDDHLAVGGSESDLDGGGGNDHLAAGGSDNRLFGGDGEGDVCTDLSSLNHVHDTCEDRRKLADTPKLTHTAAGTKASAARA